MTGDASMVKKCTRYMTGDASISLTGIGSRGYSFFDPMDMNVLTGNVQTRCTDAMQRRDASRLP
jgi:hypothetical protein